MIILEFSSREECNLLPEELKEKRFYLFKNGLFTAGKHELEALDMIDHALIKPYRKWFKLKMVQAEEVQKELESGEWEVYEISRDHKGVCFDLVYKV